MIEKKEGLSRMMEFAGKYKFLTLLAFVLSAISAVLALGPFVCLWFVAREIITSLPKAPNVMELSFYGWCAVFLAVVSMLIYFIALMCSHVSAFRIARNMRIKAIHHIVKLPLGFFSSNNTGKLRKVIDDNAGLTETFLAHQLPDLAGAIVSPIAIFILLFIFDWRLGAVCLIPTVIGVLCLKKLMGGEKADSIEKYQNALEEMSNEAVEYIRGIPVVKVFQQTVFSFKSFYDSINKYSKFASSYAAECQIPMTIFTVAVNGAFVFLIPVGVLVIKNTSDYKGFLLDFIFYVLFTPVSVNMLTKIMKIMENIMVAKEAVKRIDAILYEKPLKESEDPRKINGRRVSFEHVTFTYPGNTSPTVDDISFTINEGETIALVGASGSGKSTVAGLIPRFFDVNKGNVKIDGVDVRDVLKKDLMDKVSFVFQNTRLLKASILENIRIAKPKATIDEVLEAVREAQCTDIIEKFPEGINTVIGGKGIYLSGGECQRIALARAILKDSPIVILDEATAFADPENESQIQKAFEKLTKGKTVLMIAHRLSTICGADKILVMSDGRIKEQGKHEELLKDGGMYAHMWKEYCKSISWKVTKKLDENNDSSFKKSKRLGKGNDKEVLI
ncbi:ABC transporter ATP-binding protein [Clostridium beijerinckii]|uniref:ABC transporter ATP-binding protein n=1 Tax=Clostridium beijerinckii TaxID=1520 RepID=UPI0022DFBA75|nr:ABC transporter ATP-binding protein [Clostridium beijerinckii]